MRAPVRLALVFVACLVLVGCRVDSRVDVDVHEDGSGEVVVSVLLDDDAVARVPDLPAKLPVNDLAQAGWTVDGPTKQADGRTLIRAQKPFASAADLPRVLGEVTGPGGPMRDVVLDHDRAFARTRWTFRATADFSKGAAAFSDDQLAALLGGQPLGRDLGALEAETGPLRTNTSVTLHLKVPGKVSGNADKVDAAGGQWTFALGDQPRQLVLAGTTTSAAAWQWAVGAAAGAVLLLLLVAFGWRRRRARWRREAADPRPGTATAAPAPEPTDEAPGESLAPRKLEVVALDAYGAMFTQTDPVTQVLLPFVAARGGITDPARVRAAHGAAIEGHIDSAALWSELGVPGDPAALDAALVDQLEPTANLADFAALVGRRGIRVACVANEVAAWAALLQQRYTYVQPWVVSAELGVLVPGPAVFEHLATRTGVPLRNVLYLDDSVERLDAARALGVATALFGDATPVNGSKHRHARGFSDLLRAGR